MSVSSISPDVLRLLEKISHLTIDEAEKVEDFIDFLRSKKEKESDYLGIVPDNTKDRSTDTTTTSNFLVSSTSSQSGISTMQPQQTPEPFPSPLYVPGKPIGRNEVLQESDSKEKCKIESNYVIVAPEESISEKHPTDIDFADINARFAKKREEQRSEKNNRGTHSEDLDWL
jgi:hypothetical protein